MANRVTFNQLRNACENASHAVGRKITITSHSGGYRIADESDGYRELASGTLKEMLNYAWGLGQGGWFVKSKLDKLDR